jgi:hypothetical protein
MASRKGCESISKWLSSKDGRRVGYLSNGGQFGLK